MNLNAGQVIERIVRRDRMGISELSRKLKVSRRTIYNWFDQESLSFDVIYKIGNVIQHDFSEEFPEFGSVERIQPPVNALQTNENNVGGSVSYWMNKYIRLLEKYNELLSHKMPGKELSQVNQNDRVKDHIMHI